VGALIALGQSPQGAEADALRSLCISMHCRWDFVANIAEGLLKLYAGWSSPQLRYVRGAPVGGLPCAFLSPQLHYTLTAVAKKYSTSRHCCLAGLLSAVATQRFLLCTREEFEEAEGLREKLWGLRLERDERSAAAAAAAMQAAAMERREGGSGRGGGGS
jgi:hypothetical protein